jgi:hypothetical protein
MKPSLLSAMAAALALLPIGCGRDSRAATQVSADPIPAAPRIACGHLVCGSNFFIDIDSGDGCAIGAPCTVAVTLVATGAFHINDEYPYKFKADESSGVEFLGTDAAGGNVFSKVASDWHKKDEKTGTMAVKLRSASKGQKNVTGLFKLSVCSAQACQLEQQPVSTTVAVR